MLWGVVAQAEQLGQLLPQQGNRRFPLAAGIGPEDGDGSIFCIAVDVAATQLLDQGFEQGAGRRHGRTKLRLSSKQRAMERVNIHQAKTQLSQLLQVVEQGEEVVIARAGVPIARLVGWQAPAQPVAAPGAMRGQIQLADDFDAPLDELFEALT